MIKVSIIVPVRNDTRVESCLKSLMILDYKKNLFEIIVVDNNSAIDVRSIVKKFPVIYVKEPKIGISFARNKGINLAKGDIVAFIDADCIADSRWIRRIVSVFDAYPRVGGVGGAIKKAKTKTWVQKESESLGDCQFSLQYLTFFPRPYIIGANSAYKTSVLKRLGCYDTDLALGEDVDMAWRVGLAGYEFRIAREAVVYHVARKDMKSYFKQFFNYSVGHVLLFKKYKKLSKKSIYLNTYPIKELFTYLLKSLIVRRKISKKKLILILIKDFAIILGNIYGSMKYRVVYL